LLCIFVHALHAVLLLPLSNLLCGRVEPGLYAAVYTVFVPTIRVLPQWEAIYSAVAIMLFCLVLGRMPLSGWRTGAVMGAFCGLLLLLNPAAITVCGLATVFFLFSRRVRPRTGVAFIGSFVIAAVFVCLPWTVRNHRQLGAWFFIRDNLGLELYTSNADCADARDAVNSRNGCHLAMQANYNVKEAMLTREMGEARYNRIRMAAALGWIRLHTARFRSLTLSRIREFWLPSPEKPAIYEYSVWAITALSIVGLYMMRRHGAGAWLFLAAVLSVYPLIYYFVQAAPRFRIPILWISLLPAGVAMHHLGAGAGDWIRRRWMRHETTKTYASGVMAGLGVQH
jgi:hypothetical protein